MRAVFYRPDLTPTADTTWIPGGNPATLGRNYGLVQAYRFRRHTYVDLIAGCSVQSMRRAMRNADDWNRVCGIVRHFERFRVSNSIARREGPYYGFLSTHGELEGRVEFPSRPRAALAGPGTSWTIFNLYRGGQWAAQVFDHPGATAPRLELPGWFVWDTADLDADGKAEVLATAVRADGLASVYGMPWEFDILRFDGIGFVSVFHADTVVPALLRYASTPSKHTTEENIFGSFARDVSGDGRPDLLVEDSSGRLSYLSATM
jgi:hypothetical protein